MKEFYNYKYYCRFVESQFQKYFNGNDDFVRDILPKLYHDVSREFVQQVHCNREFDYSSCTMPAAIKFEVCLIVNSILLIIISIIFPI